MVLKMIYECRDCDYSTADKSNWQKHLLTTKHLNASKGNSSSISSSSSPQTLENSGKSSGSSSSSSYETPIPKYKRKPIHWEVVDTEPDITREEEINHKFQIVGDTADKVGKASSDVVKSRPKPKANMSENTDKKDNSLAIALFSILLTGVVLYILFRQQINDFLGIGDMGSNLPVWSSDNETRVIR